MKPRFKFTIIIFFSFVLITNVSLYGANLPDNNQEDIKQYTTTLKLLQKNIYTLAQSILFSPDTTSSSTKYTISSLRSSLDDITNEISLKLSNTSKDSPLYRNLLILLNAANYIKASVYELELLAQQNAPSEKMSTLERYFNFRVYANNSIGFFDNLQSLSS